MKKLICLMMLLLTSALMFGATIWLPNMTVPSYPNGEQWVRYHNVTKWSINTTSGVLTFVYDGKRYYSTVYVIEE